MRWLLGLDLRGTSGGVIGWTKAIAKLQADDQFHAVHVAPLNTSLGLVERALGEFARDDAAGKHLTSLRVEQSDDVTEGLIAACGDTEAAALVIGRKAERHSDEFIRLGKIARRLLRTLVRPTVVVPPDLTVDTIGRGPVLVASDGDPRSIAACQFAAGLAAHVRRELVVVHVVDTPSFWDRGVLSVTALGELAQELREEGHKRLVASCAAAGLSGHRTEVLTGDVVETLRLRTEALDPIATVVGSRRLSALERVFTTSVASELAAIATSAVIVVPPSLQQSVAKPDTGS